MLNGKPVLGVCVTKTDDNSRAEYMSKLHLLANESGYKLIIFNSFIDFYNVSPSDKGAKSVFSIINHDIIDALVIYVSSFCSKTVVDEIIFDAQMHGTPVILIGSTAKNCFSVLGDYEQPFKKILRHVIHDHGVVDTHFIGGVGDNDEFSGQRMQCYKEVLEENGLAFSEDMVDYGQYWGEPTRKIVKKLLADGKKPPQAIICANDYMAFAVCDELKENGYRVPEDVIVTGYDGVPASNHFAPRLTTCVEDLGKLAEKTLEAVAMALEGKDPCVLYNEFIPRISESCGCGKVTGENFRDVATSLYNTIDNIKIHEEFIYSSINNMLGIKDINDLYNALADCTLNDSYVCFNSNFVSSIISNEGLFHSQISDDLVVIPSRSTICEANRFAKMSLKDLIPFSDSWNDDSSAYILTSIYVGNDVYGYYAIKTDDIIETSYKIKRVVNTINIAFTIATGYFKQMSMRLSIKRSSVINTLTDLPNLKGTATWYEEFATPDNQTKPMTLTVYSLPKYAYILENYGIESAEESLVLVANALKLANTEKCFIGHISQDEFVVINYFESDDEIEETINNASAVFFSTIEDYNANSGKEYFVEVNSGCTAVSPDWSGSIESYIKFANGEMYMNRLKSGMGNAVREESSPKVHYKTFELLIEKNLFHYNYQPIVNAKNGEIFAYEALMRTSNGIDMCPVEILDAARKYNRLYDIEKSTMFNIMEQFAADPSAFFGKKLFVNTMPGYFLSDSDIDLLVQKYGGYMDQFIFELTEQDTVSDEDLEKLRRLNGGFSNSHIAIDDYGTGHSNIVNLMRYAPQIIKIDHFLISDIHKNLNKRHFVRSTIEFAKLNNIMVLAEGVETSNELHTLIDLGIDLVQGFYTGHPAPVPVASIDEEIRQEIINANPIF